MRFCSKAARHPYAAGGAEDGHRWPIAIAVILIAMALSGQYLHFAWNRYQKNADLEAVILTQSVEAMLHPEHIAMLSGGAEDLKKPEYINAKYSLMRLVETTNPIRFAYLMGLRSGNLVFLVDSESTDSPDYSPPGHVYEEATKTDLEPFRSGQTVLTDPSTDRWGTWISALVPVRDPMTERIVAVFGVDYSASEWYASIWKRMIPDVVVVLSLFLLVAALLRIWLLHITLKASSEKLSMDEALFHSVFDQAPVGIAIGSNDNIVCRSQDDSPNVNRKFEKIVGRNLDELSSLRWTDITHPDDLKLDLEKFEQFKTGELHGYSMEKRYVRPDKSSVWVNMMIAPLIGGPGPDSMHLCLLEDISNRKQMEEALRESERSKAVLLSHLPGMAYRCRYDREWTMLFVSEGCQALTGYTPESLINNRDLSFNEMISPDYRELLWYEWKRVLDQKRHFRYEYEIKTKTGEREWVLELGQGIFDDAGNIEALEGIVIDITEQKKREAQITYLSERDLLTGLYNRCFYEKKKEQLDRMEFWPLSIVICDINGLKMINDAFGHAEGDRLITDVGRLIQSCCRKEDVVSRTGGDEFTVLMPRADGEQARLLVAQIEHKIETYDRTESHARYEVSLSIGYGAKESAEQSIDDAEKVAGAYLNHRKLLNQKSSHNAILSSIMATLAARSQETEEHGQRLTHLTKMIGERLALEQKSLDNLELLSMLHDIGKIGVDDRILNKPGRLTSDEWEQMKKHSEIGYRIAMSTPELEHMAEYILYHHERWDGTGYPARLKGQEIPLPARILAVADSYDAMTEDRAYRRALHWEAAIEEIERCSGTQFDPDVARLFVDLIRAQKDVNDKPFNRDGRVE